jgi:hypothetical protein
MSNKGFWVQIHRENDALVGSGKPSQCFSLVVYWITLTIKDHGVLQQRPWYIFIYSSSVLLGSLCHGYIPWRSSL